MPKRVPEETRKALVEKYSAGASSQELADLCGVNQTTMSENLRRWGVASRRTGPRRIYTLNEEYFDSIDAEEKAYWLGFLLADGSVTQSGAGGLTLRVELQPADDGHLKLLAVALGFSGPIRYRIRKSDGRKYARLVVSSTKLCRALEKQQCYRNKTCRHGMPDVCRELLIPLFRGYFDGDGCLCESKGCWYFTVVGAPLFVRAYLSWLRAEVGGCNVAIRQRGRASYFSLCGAPQCRRVIRLLYSEATVSLERKRTKALRLLAQE